jgi:hypothetical protein
MLGCQKNEEKDRSPSYETYVFLRRKVIANLRINAPSITLVDVLHVTQSVERVEAKSVINGTLCISSALD